MQASYDQHDQSRDHSDDYPAGSDDQAIISLVEGWQIEDFQDLVVSAE